MDHILANAEKPVPSAEELAEDDEIMNEAVAGMEEAKSIKCSECGKTFRSQATASFHAEKSGHQEFEESTEEVSGGLSPGAGRLTCTCHCLPSPLLLTPQIKPLTEEEKKAKLEELRAKLAAKRAVQSKEDAKDQRANEVSSRLLNEADARCSAARPDRTRARSARTCRPRSSRGMSSARSRVRSVGALALTEC